MPILAAEDEIAMLINQESQFRKSEVAEAAAGTNNSDITHLTSSRRNSGASRNAASNEKRAATAKRPIKVKAARKHKYKCSKEGCTIQLKAGGVCIEHGTTVKCKQCSKEGCANQALERGMCWSHFAKLNPTSHERRGDTGRIKGQRVSSYLSGIAEDQAEWGSRRLYQTSQNYGCHYHDCFISNFQS